ACWEVSRTGDRTIGLLHHRSQGRIGLPGIRANPRGPKPPLRAFERRPGRLGACCKLNDGAGIRNRSQKHASLAPAPADAKAAPDLNSQEIIFARCPLTT